MNVGFVVTCCKPNAVLSDLQLVTFNLSLYSYHCFDFEYRYSDWVSAQAISGNGKGVDEGGDRGGSQRPGKVVALTVFTVECLDEFKLVGCLNAFDYNV